LSRTLGLAQREDSLPFPWSPAAPR
jgi:hypothetical protein